MRKTEQIYLILRSAHLSFGTAATDVCIESLWRYFDLCCTIIVFIMKQVTKWMECGSCCESKSPSHIKEIFHLICNQNFYYRLQKSQLLDVSAIRLIQSQNVFSVSLRSVLMLSYPLRPDVTP